VDRAARKVQERKRQLDAEDQQAGQRRLQDAAATMSSIDGRRL
jgi:hypothetical protein